MIFVIDDDAIMAECIAKNCNDEVKIFGDAIGAMAAISDGELPDLVFLDIMLNGPDGFTFLNELVSYDDTVQIPVVIVSSMDFGQRDLSAYGVVEVLDKCKMKPMQIERLVLQYAKK